MTDDRTDFKVGLWITIPCCLGMLWSTVMIAAGVPFVFTLSLIVTLGLGLGAGMAVGRLRMDQHYRRCHDCR